MTPGRVPRLAGLAAGCVLALCLCPPLPADQGQRDGDRTPAGTRAETPGETVSSPTQAPADPQLAVVLGRMESVYARLESYRCDFLQVSETRPLQRRKESTGELFFQKPDRMRWRYSAPEARDIYLAGDRMILHMPERATAFVQPLGQALAGAAPARLFLGPSALGETFRIALADPGPAEAVPLTTCLRLTPRNQGGMSVEEVLLWVGQDDFLPRKTRSRDILGNVTTLYFLHGKTNLKLDASLFRFDPPPGTEIVEESF